MFNGSRQSNNFTANAGGVGRHGTRRYLRCRVQECLARRGAAVTGHEIGHYVLKHTWWRHPVLSRSPPSSCSGWPTGLPVVRRGVRKHRANLAEPRGIPVLFFMVSLFGLLGITALQHLQPNPGDAGGRVFPPDGKPARRLVDVAREDRRISLPAAGQDRGGHILRSPVGRGAGAAGDGMEGRASGAANPLARQKKNPLESAGLWLVAGVGFEPATFRL